MWLLFIFLVGSYIISKHRSAMEEIRTWSTLSSSLERAIEAARHGAENGCVDAASFRAVLLDHGILAWKMGGTTERELHLSIDLGNKRKGVLRIDQKKGGTWIGTVSTGWGKKKLEIKALLFPPGSG